MLITMLFYKNYFPSFIILFPPFLSGQRMYPITGINNRRTNQDLVLSGYKVPAGVSFLSVAAMFEFCSYTHLGTNNHICAPIYSSTFLPLFLLSSCTEYNFDAFDGHG